MMLIINIICVVDCLGMLRLRFGDGVGGRECRVGTRIRRVRLSSIVWRLWRLSLMTHASFFCPGSLIMSFVIGGLMLASLGRVAASRSLCPKLHHRYNLSINHLCLLHFHFGYDHISCYLSQHYYCLLSSLYQFLTSKSHYQSL